MNRLSLVLFFLIAGLASPLLGAEPPVESAQGEIYLLGGKLHGQLTTSITSPGPLEKIESHSEWTELNALVDGDLTVRESSFAVKDHELARLLDHNRRETRWDEKRSEMSIRYYQDDKLRQQAVISYDPSVLDSDLLYFILQRKIQEGAGEFDADVIIKSKGMKVNCRFHLLETKDFLRLSPKYDFPAPLRKLNGKEETLTYVISVNGPLGWFYPYKFYCVYSKNPPHSFIAYWGGEPRFAEYIFATQ